MLINRDFRRMWVGYAVSALGDQIFDTTILLWLATVLLRDHRLAPVAVGGVVMTVSVATILIGPFAGVFVDRWDKRRTLLAADAIRAGLVGLVAVFAFLPAGTLGTGATLVMIYTAVLLTSAATQFFRPAWFTLTSDVVPDEAGRGKAAGINQATAATMVIIGPPLAAPLLFGVGYQWALAVNALSFVVSYLAVRGVRPPVTVAAAPAGPRSSGLWQEFKTGLRFVGTSKVILMIFQAVVIVTIGAGALNTLNVFFVTENLSAQASLYGFLGTAEGVGLVIGSILTGWLVARAGAMRVFWIGLVS